MMPGCVCAKACAGGSVNSPLVTTSAVYWQLDVPALTATTSVNPVQSQLALDGFGGLT